MSIVIAGIKFYTVLEVAKLLKVATPTVRAYIKNGRLKGQRVGRPILISEQSFMEFLQGGAQKTKEIETA